MEKLPSPSLLSPSGISPQQPPRSRCSKLVVHLLIACAVIYSLTHISPPLSLREPKLELPQTTIYGKFPRPDDPLKLIPCTNSSLPPSLDDPNPDKTWESRFDTNINNWSWANETIEAPGGGDASYRGIYLCGYLDVPLNYWNDSDPRIVRLAVTKFQVSGLARRDGRSPIGAGMKSERTLFIEPGGPGGSGTSFVWRSAEQSTKRFAKGQYDVIGWDPRGVNASLPAIACYPHRADRDRWALLTNRYRAEVASPAQQIRYADAMYDATWQACRDVHGDLLSFMSTTSVARDLDELRKAAGEERLSGWFVSYGTGIGQTYVNMFPKHVGNLILDGTEYVKDHRLLGGFGWTSLDNVTDAWHDGFLGECLDAGPEHCALAKPLHGQEGKKLTLDSLQHRVESFIGSLIQNPVPAYTNKSGPMLITYSQLVGTLYGSLYQPKTWPLGAQLLYELESGNTTLAAQILETEWAWSPTPAIRAPSGHYPWSSNEHSAGVICADAFDAPQPEDGLAWYESLWANMTEQSWISGDSRFHSALPCRSFGRYWPSIPGVYRGDLNHTLSHPVLLIAESYDPATPLRNGRRLLVEMGRRNARLVAHHGYGHASGDTSSCTDGIARRYIMEGEVPEETETACFADEKPYRYKEDMGKSVMALLEEHMVV